MQRCPKCGSEVETGFPRAFWIVSYFILFGICTLASIHAPQWLQRTEFAAFMLFSLLFRPLSRSRVKNHIETDIPASGR